MGCILAFVAFLAAALCVAYRSEQASGLRAAVAVAARKWFMFPLMLYALSHFALFSFSKVGMTVNPDLKYETGPREAIRPYPSIDGVCKWDCLWFAKIAREGYPDERTTNFFPLFPLLGRYVHKATGLEIHAALVLVANAASLGALLTVYRIFLTLEGEAAAKWGLSLFVAYPFAFFQATGYPESLMILCSAMAVGLALRGNHIAAGFALGIGTLARHLTLLAGASLLAAQLRQRGSSMRQFFFNPGILGLLVPWLFFGGYLYYQHARFGNPLAFYEARGQWGPLATWGIGTLLNTQEQNEHIPIMYAYLPFALLVTAGALALLTRRQWIELGAFAVVLLLLLWGVGIWGIGRYSASCWPAFLPLGVWLSKRPSLQGPVITVLALFQGLFFYLFSHGFPIL
jgi:Gpi18-like mannosyltransferase